MTLSRPQVVTSAAALGEDLTRDVALVHQKPQRETGGFARAEDIDTAVGTGLRRLLGTAGTDLQLTATLTFRRLLGAEKVRVHRRGTRPGACPLCSAASDQVYHVADLLPMHNSCHCIVVPGGALPEALQCAGDDQDPTGGRCPQIGQNAEIGPVLGWGDKTKGAGRRRPRPTAASGSGTGGTPPGRPPTRGATPDPPERPRLTGADAAQHLQRQLLPYMHSLPEPIQAAVKAWYEKSADLQAVARGQVLRVGHRTAQRHRIFLREAIAQAPRLSEPLTLWRGASTREEASDWAIRGFYAISTGKNIAQRFAAESGGAVYQVDVDPGVRGLWLRFQGKHGDQYEFLVDEGTRIVRIGPYHVRLVPESRRR